MNETSKRKALGFILLLVVVGQASIDIYLPSIPAMMSTFAASAERMQLTVSIFLLGYGGSQLVYGPLSDRFGRKAVLLFGLPLFIAATLGICVTTSATTLLLLRALQGVAMGAASVCARAIMRDCFEPSELPAASSTMAMGWALVPILAPMLGGYLQHYLGWQYSFGFLALLATSLLLYLTFGMRETNQLRTRALSLSGSFAAYALLLRSRAFRANMLMLGVLVSIFSVTNIATPFILQSAYHLSPVHYGWSLLTVSSGYLIGSFINKKVVARHAPVRVTGCGAALLALFGMGHLAVCLTVGGSVLTLVAFLFAVYMALGLIFANCLSACMRSFPQHAGSASALYGALVFCSGFAVSALYAHACDSSPETFAWSMAGLGLVMLGFYVFYVGPADRAALAEPAVRRDARIHHDRPQACSERP